MAQLKRWVGIDQGCTKMLMTAQVEGGYIDKTVPTGMDVTPEYLAREISAFIEALPYRPEGIGMATVGLVEGGDTLASSHLRALEGMKLEGYVQERASASEEYIPVFAFQGVIGAEQTAGPEEP